MCFFRHNGFGMFWWLDFLSNSIDVSWYVYIYIFRPDFKNSIDVSCFLLFNIAMV
jgi:hypothetical protein